MKTKLLAGLIASLFALTVAAVAATPVENWSESCASCHGEDGKGQTKIGKKLALKDYTDAAALDKFTDEDLYKATAEGVVVEGKQKMKPCADKLSADEIKGLVKVMRDFSGK